MEEGVRYPLGFKSSGVACGIKKGGKKDLALIYSEAPAVVAGVFTRNKVKAPPVVLDMERVKGGCCRAIVINSGNANACTGGRGMRDADTMSAVAARSLGIDKESVLVSSTGVIGAFLPMGRIKSYIPAAVDTLSPCGWGGAAEAIMTTDTRSKLAVEEGRIGGKTVRILGIAKGAGMIAPDMATMLAFIVTDMAIGKFALRSALKSAVDVSFNRITVDGDSSTNDTVLLLANGLAGNGKPGVKDGSFRVFKGMLERLCTRLAHMIVRDGEGATKFVEIEVGGARTESDAQRTARVIANSLLVKTAFFGEDANWGRIVAAVGRSGADIEPDKIGIYFDGVPVVRAGTATGKEGEVADIMKRKEIKLKVDLKLGKKSAVIWTTDLSYDYVRINASYRS